MSIGISWYVLTVNLDVTHLYLNLIIDCFIKGEYFHLFFFLLWGCSRKKERKILGTSLSLE